MDKKSPLTPPVAPRRPHSFTAHGVTIVDDYAWLKDENWQEVLRDPSILNADIRGYLEAENAFLKEANSRLEHLVREFRRSRFGPRSEKLDPDQQQLAFEDIEIAIAEVRESVTRRTGASREANVERQQRRSRALPKELPHIERVIEPASIACPCGCGTMAKIGEDRTERLDVTPAQFQVIVTIRTNEAACLGS